MFGSAQAVLAFGSIVLALLIIFDAFNIQSSMNIPKNSLNFYVIALIAIGFVFFIGGLFLIYDWWESR